MRGVADKMVVPSVEKSFETLMDGFKEAAVTGRVLFQVDLYEGGVRDSQVTVTLKNPSKKKIDITDVKGDNQ